MRAFLAALAVAALLAVPASAQRARRPAAPMAHDWSRMVVRTPEGGFRMGNPAAPVKLVEYGSITCSHCAEFSAQGADALRDNYIRPGRVSWEYRPYLIFPTDPAVFLLLNCLGPGHFFAASEQLYASQSEWTGRVMALPEAEAERLSGLPPARQAAGLIRAAGLDRFFQRHGLTPARINGCLNNGAALNRLGEITQMASDLGVQGTPTFFINGRLVAAQNWARLEPMLAGR